MGFLPTHAVIDLSKFTVADSAVAPLVNRSSPGRVSRGGRQNGIVRAGECAMVAKAAINRKPRFSAVVPGIFIGLSGLVSCTNDPPKYDGGTSQSACSTDSDCTRCLYFTAPENSSQCEIDASSSCCSGPVLNKQQCTADQSTWESNCPAKPSRSQSPCPISTCGVACRNGVCVESC